ncbi:hypothetical protein V6Z12_D01G216300 [Gossypium hirsutum]
MELFSKKLTPTDCLKRLSIPSRVLTSFPQFHGGHAVNLLVRYEAMEWPLVCTTCKKGRYKKPVISRGWRRFVLGNGLNVGDHLTFHKEEDDNSSSLHFRVELKKATNPSTSTTPCKSKSNYSKERERQIDFDLKSTDVYDGDYEIKNQWRRLEVYPTRFVAFPEMNANIKKIKYIIMNY